MLELQADCRPSPPLRSPRRWGFIGLLAACLALGLLGLRAAGNEPVPATDPPDAALAPEATAADASLPDSIEDASVEEMLPSEPSSDDGKSERGEGEGVFATFPVPSFASLAAIPNERDFLARAVARDGRLVVEGADPKVLTVDPSLQKKLTELLKSYEVPYGAIAAVEPSTGRVLALAEHSHDAPAMRGLPVKAVYPAASVFKIVTGAALLSAGTSPEESVCFHGGKRKLEPKLLEDNAKADYRCSTFAQAMGYSFNVVFGKLAKKKLDTRALKGFAQKFGFNEPVAFAEPADVSVARIPDDSFGMARAAAGFGEVFLSPLHGALMAAAVGNKGVMMSPLLFEGESPQSRRVIEEPIAAQLAQMLELTVTDGTARRAFRERGRNVLGEVHAAGKTGSLSDKKPFRDFSWFVGFAPRDNPKIAVAAVVVNGPLWRVHASYLAREAMRIWLEPPKPPRAPRKNVAKR